ncbi:hypothetical protein, partial [Pectobacterium polaris]|uniref:hypothetical protein n=1 Tax=Pectobacterium polaris TaxID=2042057 RepID=UPI0020C14E2C
CNPVLFATRPLLLPSPLPWLPHASGSPGAARRYPDLNENLRCGLSLLTPTFMLIRCYVDKMPVG